MKRDDFPKAGPLKRSSSIPRRCSFCPKEASGVVSFIEERLRRMPRHVERELSVCEAHQDPFRSSEDGAMPDALMARGIYGEPIIVVSRAKDAAYIRRLERGF